MTSKSPFKWRHFAPDIILWGVLGNCLYPISYRQLEEMMCERGVEVDHCIMYRWVHQYAPEIDKRCRPHLQLTNDSWRTALTMMSSAGVPLRVIQEISGHNDLGTLQRYLEVSPEQKRNAVAVIGF